MSSAPHNPTHTDTRRQTLDQIMRQHDHKPDTLIEALHVAQDIYGFLAPETLGYIAEQLHLAPSQVFGVATFYNQFSLTPKGQHTLTVCTGTACHVKGNNHLLTWLRTQFDLSPGMTTPDDQLSLIEVRCIGACALAPVFLTDGNLMGKQDLNQAQSFLQEWIENATKRT